jgi:uncharacterized protein with FMN-binding domain
MKKIFTGVLFLGLSGLYVFSRISDSAPVAAQGQNTTTTGDITLTPAPLAGTPPTPSPTPLASTNLSMSDRVQVSSGPLNVRATANIAGTVVGTQAMSMLGTVIGGPINQGGFHWWQLNYDAGSDGWSVEDYLVNYGASTPRPTNPMPVATSTPVATPAKTGYKDGVYTGSVADAYYGLVQVKATIKGGLITDVAFLQYPNKKGHTAELSSQVMPMLTTEAIKVQSAQVDMISGATQTVEAFQQSLASALAQATA